MVYFRFKASESLTEPLALGPLNISPGQEFVLSEYAATKWISKRNFTKSYITFLGQAAGESRLYIDKNTIEHLNAKAKQDGALPPPSFSIAALPVVMNIGDNEPIGNKTGFTVTDDALFEGFEINNLIPEEIGANEHDFTVTAEARTGWGDTEDRDLIERSGFNDQLPMSVILSEDDQNFDFTDAARQEVANPLITVPLDAKENRGNFCYVGFWDKFCGVKAAIGVANDQAADVVVQYLKVDADGNEEWVDLVVEDTTNDGVGSLEVDGEITWEIPSDWTKTSINSSLPMFYVRLANGSANAMKDDTSVSFIRIVTSKLTSYDTNQMLYAGDKVWINLASIGGAEEGLYVGTLYLRRVN